MHTAKALWSDAARRVAQHQLQQRGQTHRHHHPAAAAKSAAVEACRPAAASRSLHRHKTARQEPVNTGMEAKTIETSEPPHCDPGPFLASGIGGGAAS